VFTGTAPSDDEIARHYEGYPRNDFDSPITRLRYRELLASFRSYEQTGRILDIGCGVGFFLEEARAGGWSPFGTEYGRRAVEINRAKGLDVADASTSPLPFEPASFDVVTAFEVVEHVVAPRHELAVVARLLRPGGLFYCTTPNFNSLSRRLLRDQWGVIEYPEHLNYFTPLTLRRLTERVGLLAVSVSSSGVSLQRAPTPGNTADAAAPASGQADAPLRSRIEHSRLLGAAKGTVNALLNAAHGGDTLKGRFALPGERQLSGRQGP
jgi:SAM-dependent methyltransferase